MAFARKREEAAQSAAQEAAKTETQVAAQEQKIVKEKPHVFLNIKNKPVRANVTRVEHDVTVPSDTTIENIQDPQFWTAVSGDCFSRNPHNKLDIYWEDGTQYAEAVVLQAGHNYAIVRVTGHWKFEGGPVVNQPDLYDITHTGPVTGYRIIRKSDNQPIRDGFRTREEAERYIRGMGA